MYSMFSGVADNSGSYNDLLSLRYLIKTLPEPPVPAVLGSKRSNSEFPAPPDPLLS